MRKLVVVAGLALAIAACDSEPEPAAPQPDAAASPSEAERVAALSDPQRRAVFLRAIRDAGLDCQHVGSAAAGGTYRGQPVWRATCDGGTDWTIVIGQDGTAQILNANEATLVTDALGNGS